MGRRERLVKNTLIVNLFGEACTGKSTHASGLYSYLKKAGISCELVRESVKDVFYSGDKLPNQMLITGRQIEATDILLGKVDIVITDSPIALGAIYSKIYDGKGRGTSLASAIYHKFSQYNNYNILLKRDFEFIKEGRGSGHTASKVELELSKFSFYDEIITSSELKDYHDLMYRILKRFQKDNLSF